MNLQAEYTLKSMIIGMIEGLVEALKGQQAELLPRAIAHQRFSYDAQAVRSLREIAEAYNLNPGWAEMRYWEYLDNGYTGHVAYDNVTAELENA
jgi:hypothetical protein